MKKKIAVVIVALVTLAATFTVAYAGTVTKEAPKAVTNILENSQWSTAAKGAGW